MSLSPNADLLQEGLALHRRGAVAEAATRYAAVPRADPNNVDANYYLVAIHCQQGRFDDGAAHARKRSIAIRGTPVRPCAERARPMRRGAGELRSRHRSRVALRQGASAGAESPDRRRRSQGALPSVSNVPCRRWRRTPPLWR